MSRPGWTEHKTALDGGHFATEKGGLCAVPIAVCISCGSLKRRPFDSCTYCGYDPRSDNVAMAKSLVLSDRYYITSEDRYLTRAELEAASVAIKRGQYVFDSDKIASLVKEKRTLDQAGSPPWWRVIIFILLILAIPLAAAVHFLIRVWRRLR